MKPERFGTLAEVHRYRDQLRAARSAREAGLKRHWEVLGDGEFHQVLLRNAVHGLWKDRSPLDLLKGLGGASADLAGMALGLALGSKARTTWGRLLIWAAGAATPMVRDALEHNGQVQHVLSELARSWSRIKDYVRQRRRSISGRP